MLHAAIAGPLRRAEQATIPAWRASRRKDAALEDTRHLEVRLGCSGDSTCFVARVLVEGSWNRPDAVTPAWVIEGRERPTPVEYYFD